MHIRFGSATLSQLAFPGERNQNFPGEEFHLGNTVVKSTRKRKRKKRRRKKKKQIHGKGSPACSSSVNIRVVYMSSKTIRLFSSRLKPRSAIRHCLTTVGQNIHLLWEQTDSDFTVGQCLVSDENTCQAQHAVLW